MTEQPNNDFLKKLVNGEQLQIISTSPSDISISVPDKSGGEREYIFSDTIPSIKMATSTATAVTTELKIPLPPDSQTRFVEVIEEVKATRTEESEFQFGPIKLRIKRAPQKTITRYIEQKKDTSR